MNQLLNPFLQDYPESLDASIAYRSANIGGSDVGLPTVCSFSASIASPSELGGGSSGNQKACTRHAARATRKDKVEGADGALGPGSKSDSEDDESLRYDFTTLSSASAPPVYAGQLLAVGTSEGVVDVFDLDTRARVRRFDEGHVKAVERLSWSRNGRYLLSCSRDWKLCVWDLHYSSRDMPDLLIPTRKRASKTCRLRQPTSALKSSLMHDAPIVSAEFHPRTSRVVLVTTATGQVGLVFFEGGGGRRRSGHDRAGIKVNERTKVVWLRDEPQAERVGDENGEGEGGPSGDNKRKRDEPTSPEEDAPALTCAAFHPNGERIYVGTEAGAVLLFSMRNRRVVGRHQVATTQLKQLAFDRLGRQLVLNSSDRAIRVIAVSPSDDDSGASLSPLHRFQDQISRTPWNSVGFSGDGEYVFGGAGTREAHLIYVWDAPSGVLVKVLEGTNKDPLVDCDWCPTRPLVASLTSSGTLNLFQTHAAENWSAFAPGFEELEENREYEEKEAEFDIEDEHDVQRRQEQEEEQDVEVFRDRLTKGLPVQLPLPAARRNGDADDKPRKGPNGTNGHCPSLIEVDAAQDELGAEIEEEDLDEDCTCDLAGLYPDEDLWPGFFPHVDLEEIDAENEQQRQS